MSYTDVFGGELLFPSLVSYLSITTSVDVTLQWPREQQIAGDNVVADFMDINCTSIGLNIDMPDARNASTGNKTTINAVGNDFTLRDATGGVIQFATNGTQWVIVLTDNSTEAGTWTSFQLGAGTTLASASALAGAGLQDDGGGMLEQIIDSDLEAATPITVVDGDRAKCLIYTGGAGQADLPSAGAVGNNWFFMLRNSGSGTLAIVPPSGQIDGSSSVNLDPNGSTFIFTDGTDYFTIGLTVASTIAFDYVSLPIPGSGDFVLSGANLNRIAYRFTGTLTGDRKVVVPDTIQQYWCDNRTTGAFVLSIGTNAQASPPTLDAGKTTIFYCNAIEVIDAVNAVSVSFPILVSQGGTGASDAAGARTNLGVPATTFDLQAGAGLTGGGDLSSSPRIFDVGAGDGIAVNADDVELDINGLTVAASVDPVNDTVAIYDDDAAAVRKTALSNIGNRTFILDPAEAIAFGGDGVWQTINNATLAAAGAIYALLRVFCSIAPTASTFGSNDIFVRETGSGLAAGAGTITNVCRSVADADASGNGSGWQVNDCWVKLDSNQDFDIQRLQTGTGIENHGGWIIGYVV